MSEKPLISVVIPVFNEQENLDELVRRSFEACNKTGKKFEIILIDDGSKDASAEKIINFSEKNPYKVISVILNRNYGQHAAIMAGFSQVRGEIVITIDADLQNPPEEIPRLVSKMEEGFDVVGTIRVPRNDSFLRRLPSFITNKIVQKTTGIMMHDYGCMLRAYRRNIVDIMVGCKERNTFIPVLANNFARRITEIEVSHASRLAGESKYNFFKLINLQFDLITSMTTFPLRLLSLLGVLIALLGIGFGIFLMIMRFDHGAEWAANGVFTLFAVLFIFVGAQFIGMGLLGEYIGRIFNNVKSRPIYCIDKIVGRK